MLHCAASFHHDLCAGNVLLGKSVEELAALSVSLGQPRYRGKQIFDGLLQGARSTADLHLVSSSGPVLRRLETIALPEKCGGLNKGSLHAQLRTGNCSELAAQAVSCVSGSSRYL